MTTAPFEPDPELDDQEIAAADPGQGAPDPAPGFGPGEHEPDVMPPPDHEEPDESGQFSQSGEPGQSGEPSEPGQSS